MNVYSPALADKREITILRTPHPIRLTSLGKCPKCGQSHGKVAMQKSEYSPGLYFGTCPINKTRIFVVA